MADTEQIEENEILEKSDELSVAVNTNNNIAGARTKMQALVNDSNWRRFVSPNTISGYEKYLKEQTLNPTDDTKGMEGVYDFMKQEWQQAEVRLTAIERKIDDAMRSKIASKKDRDFLMKNLILTGNFDFNGENVNRLERAVDEKIDRMQKDKNAYDKIANHPLVRNVGYLKIDKDKKIDIPDEKRFLDMTVPERRKLLKQLQEALPKAEKYAEEAEKEETGELNKKYKDLLKGVYKKKIIGLKTYNKFWDGFQKIDKTEKEHWIKEFPKQMERYEKLWEDIRKNLKDDDLEHMESTRNKMGYSELFAEYKKIDKRLDDKYQTALKGFKEKGYIGDHTINEFMTWIKNQNVEKKYDAIEKLHDGSGGEMERYKNLWDDIEKNLPKKSRSYLESKRDAWGYKEMKEEYDRFISGEKAPTEEAGVGNTSDPLAMVTNLSVKRGIQDVAENLEKRGEGQTRSFLLRIKKMFAHEHRDQFDATDFQSRLNEDRKTKKEETEEKAESIIKSSTDNVISLQDKMRESRTKSRRHGKSIDRTDLKEEMRELEEFDQTKIVDEKGFRQVETSEKDDHSKRITQLQMNREKAMDHFFAEDHKRQYRSKEEGGHDDLSLAISADDGRTVELNLTEIRAMEKYLEEKEKKRIDKKNLDKAA